MIWNIQSFTHGSFYLSVDSKNLELKCQQVPSSWTVDRETLTLCCRGDDDLSVTNNGSIPQDAVYISHTKQNYLEVMRRRERSWTLWEALNAVQRYNAPPDGKIPLRTYCFQAAETAKNQVNPDWFQLLALIYQLGREYAFPPHSSSFSQEQKKETHRWKNSPSQSKVVGLVTGIRATFECGQEKNPLNRQGTLYRTTVVAV
uniref:Inositol oxygenase n=1 Tax=Eucampia antarctica TaxID=49252 RepID=A0A7S2R1M6_9STRA|mmetsp:Transcript_12931/g.12552  ORF Transcript_12931/g.12552 Transcript_12931/m.12552 type:complete len:202 (+) Transcript_12931:313-918(+)